MRKGWKAPFIASLCIILSVCVLLVIRSALLPRIDSVLPTAFEPGSSVVIEGRGFGETRGMRGIDLDGSLLTVSSYISWTDNRIEAIIPNTADSGLLKVHSPLGSSNAEIVVSRRRTPQPPTGETSVPVRPKISSVRPDSAQVGELIAIDGMGFGNNPQFCSVRFTLNRAVSASDAGAVDHVEPGIGQAGYESWDDKGITLRVPEGAGSGAIIVRTPQGDSAPINFELKPGTGRKNIFDPAIYTIEFTVGIQKKRIDQGGSILIYLPDPASTSYQSLDSIQDEGKAPVDSIREGLATYAIDASGPSEERVTRTARLTVSAVETDLSGYRDGFKGSQVPAFLSPFLADEQGLPAGAREVATLAARIAGRETNPQKKAVSLWTWIKKNLAWDGPSINPDRSALAALREGRADTRQFALLTCTLLRACGVPALPVSGLLVGRDGTTQAHSWLEYYLPALGWVPFDPVLATGAVPSGFDAGLEDASRYFGSLDNSHIALTRGILRIPARLRGSKLKDKGVPWSLQTLYEESSGASYSSTWGPVLVTGRY